MTLFEHHQKREKERLTFQAKIAGAEIDTEKEEKAKFLFKDPKDYEKMSVEERQKLTEEMKTHFMSKFGGGKLGG